MSFKNHETTFKANQKLKSVFVLIVQRTTLEKIERFIERFGIDEFNRLYKGTYNEDIYKLMEDFSDNDKEENQRLKLKELIERRIL